MEPPASPLLTSLLWFLRGPGCSELNHFPFFTQTLTFPEKRTSPCLGKLWPTHRKTKPSEPNNPTLCPGDCDDSICPFRLEPDGSERDTWLWSPETEEISKEIKCHPDLRLLGLSQGSSRATIRWARLETCSPVLMLKAQGSSD